MNGPKEWGSSTWEPKVHWTPSSIRNRFWLTQCNVRRFRGCGVQRHGARLLKCKIIIWKSTNRKGMLMVFRSWTPLPCLFIFQTSVECPGYWASSQAWGLCCRGGLNNMTLWTEKNNEVLFSCRSVALEQINKTRQNPTRNVLCWCLFNYLLSGINTSSYSFIVMKTWFLGKQHIWLVDTEVKATTGQGYYLGNPSSSLK